MALFRAHPFLTAYNSLPNLHVNFPFSLDFVSHGNHAAQSRGAKRTSPFLFCKRGAAGDVSLVEEGSERVVMSEYGWSVRRIKETETEMRRVAHVQAKAFHVAMPLFDDLFFEFFKAEVLAALIYRIRNSPADRYACLVAEASDERTSYRKIGEKEEVVGVVDITVMRDENVLRHLNGDREYVYVSGIAVLPEFRRRKIGKALIKGCDLVSLAWGYNSLALRAYEDDVGARALYSSAGYKVVSRDPIWMTSWIGRKRRVLMIKQLLVSPFLFGR